MLQKKTLRAATIPFHPDVPAPNTPPPPATLFSSGASRESPSSGEQQQQIGKAVVGFSSTGDLCCFFLPSGEFPLVLFSPASNLPRPQQGSHQVPAAVAWLTVAAVNSDPLLPG